MINIGINGLGRIGRVLLRQILISNNLPYINALNDGSSKQAPAGFVDSALSKGKRAVRP